MSTALVLPSPARAHLVMNIAFDAIVIAFEDDGEASRETEASSLARGFANDELAGGTSQGVLGVKRRRWRRR